MTNLYNSFTENEQVWLALPSANIKMAKKIFPIWKAKGYKIAVICPDNVQTEYSSIVDLKITESSIGGYKGWPKSVNHLSNVLSNVEIIIAAGDDMHPDPNYDAHELRLQFVRHFGGTMGVMQPYGDKFGSMACETCEQICGSAWLGKEFRNRINQGKGPMWEEYWHMWADTELYQIASKYNCLWVRSDLTQYHEHRIRGSHTFRPTIPAGNMKVAQKIYEQRKKEGFPGSELT
jgi:hypothetical protein